MQTEYADLDTHHIEGIAREGNKAFSVSLFSNIGENLIVGGCPRGAAPEWIKFIISLYPWEPYETHEGQVVTKAFLYDQGGTPNGPLVDALAKHVNECRAMGPTLVHCQAGLNRSNLVAARALILAGRTPDEAINLLREKRCDAVLCNASFERWLRDGS